MKPGILACAGLALAAALSFGCASQPKEAQGEQIWLAGIAGE